jgi:hypothetical protein
MTWWPPAFRNDVPSLENERVTGLVRKEQLPRRHHVVVGLQHLQGFVELGQAGSAYAAVQENAKFSWLRAPATTAIKTRRFWRVFLCTRLFFSALGCPTTI